MPATSFTVPYLPLTPNQRRGKHWSKYHEESIAWGEYVFVFSSFEQRLLFRQPVLEKKRILVEIKLVLETRRLDPDNLHGALKPVIDALKRNGYIKNDSPRWIELVALQDTIRNAGGKPRTEISLAVLNEVVGKKSNKDGSRALRGGDAEVEQCSGASDAARGNNQRRK